jgi:alcohol dehydrogenase
MSGQESWFFTLPTAIAFGDGVSSGLRDRVSATGSRPVIVTDGVLVDLAFMRELLGGFCGVPCFSDVEPNPTVSNVDALSSLLRESDSDVVVAVGGGSSIDCAKAACSLAYTGEQSIRPFHSGGQSLGDGRIPLIAVPTTAGTGSEVTPFAVLDDREKGFKGPIASASFYPVAAVVDPLLTHTMPLSVTAATGLDALSHALEGYWSKNHQPLCDLMAKEAARLIFRWFEAVCVEPENAEARRAMSYAATLAGAAFQLPKNAIVHACSFPLSNRYHLPHGAACAFTLEFAIGLNAPAMGGRMEELAAYCGFSSVDSLVARVREFKRLGGLPSTLADAGIDPSDVDELVRESFHPLMRNNPVEVTEADLRRLYETLA